MAAWLAGTAAWGLHGRPLPALPAVNVTAEPVAVGPAELTALAQAIRDGVRDGRAPARVRVGTRTVTVTQSGALARGCASAGRCVTVDVRELTGAPR